MSELTVQKRSVVKATTDIDHDTLKEIIIKYVMEKNGLTEEQMAKVQCDVDFGTYIDEATVTFECEKVENIEKFLTE